jgi:hypothetical protein
MVLLPSLCGPFNDTSSATKARTAEVITVTDTELIVTCFYSVCVLYHCHLYVLYHCDLVSTQLQLKINNNKLSPHLLITDKMREKKLET